jgi:hypothetical protein
MFDSPVSMPSPSIDYSEVVSVSGFTENINQQLYYMTKDDSIFYSLGWESHDGTIRFYMPKIRFARTDSAIAEGDLRRCFRISWMDERYATHKGKRTVTGAIRGWRVWKLENDQLQSMVHHTNGAWKFGWNRAPQIPGVKMGAGGFYMNRTLEQTWAHSGDMKKFMDGRVIFGSQLLKGRVIRAREGWRGEFARPEFYIATGRLDTDAALLAMGALYGMEPISLGEAWDLDVGEVAYSEEPAGGDISGDGSPDVDNV